MFSYLAIEHDKHNQIFVSVEWLEWTQGWFVRQKWLEHFTYVGCNGLGFIVTTTTTLLIYYYYLLCCKLKSNH